jgi:hypothetical protein
MALEIKRVGVKILNGVSREVGCHEVECSPPVLES